MKKTYKKPSMEIMQLLIAESLLTGSSKMDVFDQTLNGDEILSNGESEINVW